MRRDNLKKICPYSFTGNNCSTFHQRAYFIPCIIVLQEYIIYIFILNCPRLTLILVRKLALLSQVILFQIK